MLDKITKSDVEKAAQLARLGLSPKEIEKLRGDLNNILAYMEKLNELDTDGVEPLSHIMPLKNVLREDEVCDSLIHSEALENAPAKKDGFFTVPPVIE
jgi:aspartyl-tRNA(Asn)/glutamyl-tRNA(Gln) amidotransferase subunit C